MTTIRQWAKICSERDTKHFNQCQVLLDQGYRQALKDFLVDIDIVNKDKGACGFLGVINTKNADADYFRMGYCCALSALRASIKMGKEID